MPPDAVGDQDGTIEVESVIDGPHFYVQVLELPGRWLRARLDDHSDDMPAGDPGLLLDWLRGCTEDRLHKLTLLDPAGDLDVHLTDHGEPVEIPLPDEGDVIDPAELHTLLPGLPEMTEPPPSEWDR